jgi:hypothetical protein
VRGAGPEPFGEAAVGFFVLMDGARGGVATGAVAVLGDVLGIAAVGGGVGIGIGAAVGPVFLGAADGVGVDG